MGYSKPDVGNGFQRNHMNLMRNNLVRAGGVDIFNFSKAGVEAAERMFHAPFALFSYGNEEEPIYNYANLTALKLFDISWEDLTQTRIQDSFEAEEWKKHLGIMNQVQEKGALPNYCSSRKIKTGKSFHFKKGIIWSLKDEYLTHTGQAVVFTPMK